MKAHEIKVSQREGERQSRRPSKLGFSSATSTQCNYPPLFVGHMVRSWSKSSKLKPSAQPVSQSCQPGATYEEIPYRNEPPEPTPPFGLRHQASPPTPPREASWNQTSQMMLLLVASGGSEALRIEASIEPNVCFQKSSFSLWDQILLQNGTPK